MKNLAIRTRYRGNKPQYKENLNNIVAFMQHSEDRIEVKNGESVNIDIYNNGSLIFSGDKYELFEILKNAKLCKEIHPPKQ